MGHFLFIIKKKSLKMMSFVVLLLNAIMGAKIFRE